MTWTHLLANKEVQQYKTSKKELDKLQAVISRDLADASPHRASADRRFATAYNAALQVAKMAIRCAGYRVVALDIIGFLSTWLSSRLGNLCTRTAITSADGGALN